MHPLAPQFSNVRRITLPEPADESVSPTITQKLFPSITGLILENITDNRKLDAVHRSYLELGGETDAHGSGLSYEGFRQSLAKGRLPANDLPRLFEAMALNGVDPLRSLAAIEAACCPRDPELDGQLADELTELAQTTGEIAFNYKQNGNSLAGYTNTKLRGIMAIAGRIQAAARRLSQECLDHYE